MSPKLLKAIRRFANFSGGISEISISVKGGESLTIDREKSERIKRNIDAELARRARKSEEK